MGVFTAGLLLCLIGAPQSFDTCTVVRTPLSYPTEQECMQALVDNAYMLEYQFDMESYEIVDIKCTSWLESNKAI